MVVPVVVLVCECVPQQKRMTQLGAYHARMVRCTHSSGVQRRTAVVYSSGVHQWDTAWLSEAPLVPCTALSAPQLLHHCSLPCILQDSNKEIS